MADVGGAAAAIDNAVVKIAEAMTAAQTAAGLYAEAHTMLAQVQGTTSVDLGAGAVDIAREQCEQAFVRGHAAIETASVYRGTL